MFPNLKAEMARSGITSEMLSKELGLKPATMSAKLNSFNRLKYCEAKQIQMRFFPSSATDYLFALNPAVTPLPRQDAS